MTIEPDGDDEFLRRGRRRRLVIAGCVVLAGVGMFASGWVAAGQTAPATSRPDDEDLAVPVTAEVTRRVLDQRVTLVGSVQPGGRSFPVTARPEAAPPIVTAAPVAVGQEVGVGAVVGEVSGRPLFVFPGEVPAYRQLGPGTEGEDVRQLEEGLAAVGALEAEPDERYDASTGAAVRRWWDEAGYDATVVLVDAPPAGPPAGASTGGGEGAAPAGGDGGREDGGEEARPAEGAAGPGDPGEASEAPGTAGEVVVPLAEVAFIPGGPWLVSATAATVGGTPADPLVTLAEGGPALVFEADPALAGEVAVGNPVEVVLPEGRVPGRVTERSGGTPPAPTGAPSAGGPGGEEGRVTTGGEPVSEGMPPAPIRVVVAPDTPLTGAQLGRPVRAEVTVAATPAEVLVVPLTAVRDNGDGGDMVEVARPGGTTERVGVQVGLVTATHAEVRPTSGDLRTGDRVIVG